MDKVNLIFHKQNRTGESNMRIKPIECICLRCYYEWQTVDNGEGHHKPITCNNPKCRSAFWEQVPEAWFSPDFDPEPLKRLGGNASVRLIKRYNEARKEKGLPITEVPEVVIPQEWLLSKFDTSIASHLEGKYLVSFLRRCNKERKEHGLKRVSLRQFNNAK